MSNRNWSRTRLVMTVVLVAIMALVAVMPMVAHAMLKGPGGGGGGGGGNGGSGGGSGGSGGSGGGSSGSGGGSGNSGGSGGNSGNGNGGSGGSGGNSGSGGGNSTEVIIQYLYYYVYYYMYPDLKWVFTLVNIGSQQAPGYHSVGSEKLFTPGFGGNGIFVPVYSQEAIYILNIAPSTKPVITGWYVGNTQVKGPYKGSQEVIKGNNTSNNNYFVYVSVTNNTQGAGWMISSSVDSLTGSGNINNAELPIGGQTDTLTAAITNNPSNYTCTISPSTTQVTNGSTVTFTVSCTQSNNPGSGPVNYVYITVDDNNGAGWAIDSSVASINGSSTVYNEQLQINGSEDWIAATITNYPLGYDCTIVPPAEQAVAGNTYTFTVSCTPAYVYVTVYNYWPINPSWTISSSIASISGNTTVYNEQLQIAGPSDTLTATVQEYVRVGLYLWECSISPSSIQVNAYDTVSFTVGCSNAGKW